MTVSASPFSRFCRFSKFSIFSIFSIFSTGAAALTEEPGQFVPGPIQEDADTAFSKTEGGRDLPVVGAFDVRQPQQLALLRAELPEYTRHVEA
jgi:hypothetical protein